MDCFEAFCKACPTTLCLTEKPDPATPYKYYLCGKGCTLGVLFEDSAALYFEWITEDGVQVTYPPRLRYKAWLKRDVARLVCAGVWEVETERPAVEASLTACASSSQGFERSLALSPLWRN